MTFVEAASGEPEAAHRLLALALRHDPGASPVDQDGSLSGVFGSGAAAHSAQYASYLCVSALECRNQSFLVKPHGVAQPVVAFVL